MNRLIRLVVRESVILIIYLPLIYLVCRWAFPSTCFIRTNRQIRVSQLAPGILLGSQTSLLWVASLGLGIGVTVCISFGSSTFLIFLGDLLVLFLEFSNAAIVLVGLVCVDRPYFEDAILAACGQEETTGTEFYNPNRLLVRSDILNQVKITFGVPVLFVHPGIYLFSQEKVIWLFKSQLLIQKGVVVTRQLSGHL